MFTKALRLALVFLALVLSPAAQEPAKAPAAVPEVEAPEADPEALRKTVEGMLEAAKKGDSAHLASLANSLVEGDLGPWAKETFGEYLGAELAKKQAEAHDALSTSLQQMARDFASDGLSVVGVDRINTTCREDLTEAQRAFLAVRLRPAPLFEVLVLDVDRKKARAVRFFASVDGGFHYLGTARFSEEAISASRKAPQDAPSKFPQRIIVGSNVQPARLIKQPRPTYPPLARQSHIQGTVRLEAVIGKDGRIHELQLVSGDCRLAEAAADVVRQWRYTPTLLEGQPVEVQTTIDVVFKLGP